MYYLNSNVSFIQFDKVLKSDIYVDKSLMIEAVSSRIKTGNNYICITRPRRFEVKKICNRTIGEKL